MANSGYKGITRVKRRKRSSAGWQARVVFQGDLHQKFFADSTHGSRRESLAEAVDWRNEMERQLGKPRTERVVVGLSRRNKTGIIGVVKSRKPSQRPGYGKRKSRVYEVTWRPEPGVTRRTSISIEKYGEEEALRLARQIRQQAEREMYGGTLPPPKSKRRVSSGK